MSTMRGILAVTITGVICLLSGIVSGHATCMHQHASVEEETKCCCDENGQFSNRKYFKQIIKDYKAMHDDPLGLNKLLE